ncbi:ParB/Srx family N-terminal domain-containing protein [Streptomyces sp. MS06]|uniref:ParB/Srx family N-terminal domain-containing protein n=1 Tax=Streptomyces sp. MS06 TaxID=3385974 RepID=UPI00399FFE99
MPSLSRRLLSTAVGAALAAPVLLAPPAQAAGRPFFCGHDHRATPYARYLCARSGQMLDVRIGDVHPTQSVLGYDEVYYKLGRSTLGKDELNHALDDWCETDGRDGVASAQPDATLLDPSSFTCKMAVGTETSESKAEMKTVVVGPGGQPYLTDGHHTFTSFAEDPIGGLDTHIRVIVQANYSNLTRQEFWKRMKAHKWVYLRDAQGNRIGVNKLPRQVGLAGFQNDPYRGLLYFGKKVGFQPDSVPFQEFYWGGWLRDDKPVDLSGWDRDDFDSYLATVEAITRAQVDHPKDAEVGDSGFTATELGALDEWNKGKDADKGNFGKLSRPYTDVKPGKLAYALQYKAVHHLS